MHVSTVDYWATSGRSYLHRASPMAKLIAAALLLAGVVVVQNLFVVLATALLVLAAARRSGVPLGRFALIAAYPGFFALLFALAQYNGDLIIPATTIAKAVAAASVAVLLIATTPYPQLFASLRLLLPEVVVEVLYIAYRSVFILLRILSDVLAAVRLRGGLVGRGMGRRLGNLAAGLAVGAVRSFDVSDRTYAVMRLRGYSGSISGERPRPPRRADVPLIAVAGLVAATAFLFRYEWRALNPYSWLPLAVAIVVFVAALARPGTPLGRPGAAAPEAVP